MKEFSFQNGTSATEHRQLHLISWKGLFITQLCFIWSFCTRCKLLALILMPFKYLFIILLSICYAFFFFNYHPSFSCSFQNLLSIIQFSSITATSLHSSFIVSFNNLGYNPSGPQDLLVLSHCNSFITSVLLTLKSSKIASAQPVQMRFH